MGPRFEEVRQGEMPGMFISYRREDTAGHAGRLFDHLAARFGPDRVFMDVDTIEPGEDFVDVIDRRVGSCDALIALIGREWLAAVNAAGRRRLDDPGDFVRREIATAIRRGVLVVPVLVEQAQMPDPASLPEELRPLARRQALVLSDARFHEDAAALIRTLEGVAGPQAGGEAADRRRGRPPETGARDAIGRAGDSPEGTAPEGTAREKARRRRRAIATAVALAALTAIAAIAAFPVLRSGRLPWVGAERVDLSGSWSGSVRPETGDPFPVAVNLIQQGELLSGTVEFPTGTGRIIEGHIKNGRIRFLTAHVPDFETREVTFVFDGVGGPDELQLAMRYDGMVRKLVARRR